MQNWKINQQIFEAIGIKNDILGVHIPQDNIFYSNENLIETITIIRLFLWGLQGPIN